MQFYIEFMKGPSGIQQRLELVKEWSVQLSVGRVFQAEGITIAKALAGGFLASLKDSQEASRAGAVEQWGASVVAEEVRDDRGPGRVGQFKLSIMGCH